MATLFLYPRQILLTIAQQHFFSEHTLEFLEHPLGVYFLIG